MKSVWLDRPALGLVLVFLAGVTLFPWYMLQDGFWSFQWLSGYPMSPEQAPALFLLLQGKNLWLAPVVAVSPMLLPRQPETKGSCVMRPLTERPQVSIHSMHMPATIAP